MCSAILGGAVKVFSMGVCSHHFCPRRTRAGLCSATPAGRARPKVRTLTQDQQVPVQTLSTIEDSLRSFHRPAYKGTDLFHERGGPGRRSSDGLFLRVVAFFAS